MTNNPYSSNFIQSILKSRGLWLNKQRGQNYLISKELAERIVSLVPEGSTVFEVGSGLGALTFPLAGKFKTYSLEIDQGIFNALKDILQADRLFLLHGDFLTFDMDQISEPELFFLSNLPYSISGEAVRKFIDCKKFSEGIVMLQEEFVGRMLSRPGEDDFGVLSILSFYYLEIEKLFTAGRNNFFPAPSVDSVVIRLKKKQCRFPQEDFNHFLRQSFLARRKTIYNNLKNLGFSREKLVEMKINPKDRPERIELEKWSELFEAYRK